MSPTTLPPTSLLPPLPRPQPPCQPTLSPILSTRLETCIASLRTMLLPTLAGIDGSVVQDAPESSAQGSGGEGQGEGEDEDSHEVVIDEFERQWSENWLNQVIRRGETWLAEVEPVEEEDDIEHDLSSSLPRGSTLRDRRASLDPETREEVATRHRVLQQAAELVSLLSGCTASGAITRSLTFPLSPMFLASTPSDRAGQPTPFVSQDKDGRSQLEIQVNDAALADHLSVGVQTWGSSVLLGRAMAENPGAFGLDLSLSSNSKQEDGPRILELGAGTGVLSIICRALLDMSSGHESSSASEDGTGRKGLVLATDYHPLVLDNLKKCIGLNFGESEQEQDNAIPVMRLDWSTFPEEAEEALGQGLGGESGEKLDLIGKIKKMGEMKGLWSLPTSTNGSGKTSPSLASPAPSTSPSIVATTSNTSPDQPSFPSSTLPPPATLAPPLDKPFDMLIASDCVYDLVHADLIRECSSWLLRPPSADGSDMGGVLHLLSPVRRTYSAETTSILKAFPAMEALPPRIKPSGGKSRSMTPLGGRSGYSTPRSTSGVSSAHTASAVDLTQLRSGMATPVEMTEEERELFTPGMGRGRAGGWRLCTKKRVELERLKGNGRTDELIYMWWQIGWA